MVDPDGYVRIREAAIALFADKGVDGVSILDIAGAAGVSGGLIRHHFGSKDQLREACDRYVFAEIMRLKEDMLVRLTQDEGYVPAYDARTLRYYRYMGRATMDGSPAAMRHFQHIVDESARWLVEQSGHQHADPRGMAVVLAAYTIGLTALSDAVAAALDIDPRDPALLTRISTASAAIFATPLLPSDLSDRMRTLAERGSTDRDHPDRPEDQP